MKLSKLFLFTALTIFILSNITTAQNNYKSPTLSNQDSWSLILIPDTQTYVKFGRNQGILELMTGWVSENIEKLNIKMVLCTGDLVEQNEMIVLPDKVNNNNGNETSVNQWLAVSRAFKRLDGKVPYILAAGNHDFGYKNIEHRKSNYNNHFPAERNYLTHKLLRAAAKNSEGHPTLENAVFEFISPHNRKFLFMNLEFAPRESVLNWAKSIAKQKKYKDHTILVLTHSYLNNKNEHIVKEKYPIKDGNYGKAIWDKLVAPSNNIQMVISGHIGLSNNFRGHIGFRTDINNGGRKVTQMTFNAQALGGGWFGNGGDGWLRIIEFLPDGKTVKVKTYSPLFAISPSSRDKAWSKEPFNEFTFEID